MCTACVLHVYCMSVISCGVSGRTPGCCCCCCWLNCCTIWSARNVGVPTMRTSVIVPPQLATGLRNLSKYCCKKARNSPRLVTMRSLPTAATAATGATGNSSRRAPRQRRRSTSCPRLRLKARRIARKSAPVRRRTGVITSSSLVSSLKSITAELPPELTPELAESTRSARHKGQGAVRPVPVHDP